MDDSLTKYIKECKSKNISDEEIIKNLTAHGWPLEKIKPLLTNTVLEQPISTTKQTRLFFKSKIFIIIFIFTIVGGLFGIYYLLNSKTIVDNKYGFKFTNIQGWNKISPRENAYLSLATIKDNGIIFSYFDLRIQPNTMPEKFITKMLSDDYTDKFSEMCEETYKNINFNYLGIEKIIIPGTNSYKCKSEGVGTNTSGNILVMENYFIVKPKFDLLITTSYQKNLSEEAENVKRIINSLQIIN
jgi:hypothetical protein